MKQGKMKLQLTISSMTAADPILVEVEELPPQRCDAGAPCSSSPTCPTSLRTTSKPDVLLYPRSTYIKSLSHNSSISKQTSLDTNTTVEYISAHEPGQEEEEEEEEDFPEMIGFFPSHNFVMEPLEFGGKLTLDAVKINCGELFLNNF